MIETRIRLPDAPAIPGLRFRMFDPGRAQVEAWVHPAYEAMGFRRARTGVLYRKAFTAD